MACTTRNAMQLADPLSPLGVRELMLPEEATNKTYSRFVLSQLRLTVGCAVGS